MILWEGYAQESGGVKMAIQVGDRAPDFTLTSHLGKKVTLSSYRRKKNVVIAFFPLAWTPV